MRDRGTASYMDAASVTIISTRPDTGSPQWMQHGEHRGGTVGVTVGEQGSKEAGITEGKARGVTVGESGGDDIGVAKGVSTGPSAGGESGVTRS